MFAYLDLESTFSFSEMSLQRKQLEAGKANGVSMPTVDGFLAGVAVEGLQYASGNAITLVRQDYVPREAYTGRSVLLDSWRGGQTSRHKVARILIQVGQVEVYREVAVVSKLGYPAVLGTDLGAPMQAELIGRMLAQFSEESEVEELDVENGSEASGVSPCVTSSNANSGQESQTVVSSRVKSQDSGVNGWLAGVAVSGLKIDSGAAMTLVRQDFVPKVDLIPKTFLLVSGGGAEVSRHQMARILIKVGSVEELKEVAVVNTLEWPALLGADLGVPLKRELESKRSSVAELAPALIVGTPAGDESAMVPVARTQTSSVQVVEQLVQQETEELEQVEPESMVSVRSIREEVVEDKLIALVPITRVHPMIDQEIEKATELVSVLPDCNNLVLDDIFDFQDDLFETDHVGTTVEGFSCLPEVGETESPLPSLVGAGSGCGDVVFERQVVETLVLEQQSDVVLDQVICSNQKDVTVDCLVQNLADYSVAQTVATGKSSPARVVAFNIVFYGIVSLCALWCCMCSLFVAGDLVLLPLVVLGVASFGSSCMLRWVPELSAGSYPRFDTGMDFCFLWLFSFDWWRRKFKTLHPGLWPIRRGGRCYESISPNM